MHCVIRKIIAILTLTVLCASTQAQDKVNFALNWIAGGDHAPYYYAHAQGWYQDAGIDLVIEFNGCGSRLPP